MKANLPFVEGQRGTSFFWLRERVQGVPWLFMNPATNDAQHFWSRYIDYLLHTGKQFPQHISYRADSSKCDCKWLSGLILDSDINFTIDLATLQRLTDCGECDDPLECEKCKQLKHALADRYNSAPNKRAFINKFLQSHPYEPSPVEVITISNMIKELQNTIKTYFQLPTTDEDEIKQLLEPIIMLKYNAIPANDDDTEGFLYRFGYHIYFFNIKCDGQAKFFLSRQQFSGALLQQIARVWPQSTPSQVFDVQPLKGSTALPLSGPETKRYTRLLQIDFDSNNDYEIINDVLVPEMRNLYLDALNPFIGETITLKAQYIQVKTQTASITDYFNQKHYLSYLQALKFTKIDDRISVFKNNQSLNQMMSNFGHPDYNRRFSIVSYLYQYLKEKLAPQLSVDSVTLTTKLVFFVILATKEDIEAAMNLQDIHEPNANWIQQNKDRNRYPLKIDEFVDNVIKTIIEKQNSQKSQHTRTSEELWLLLFDVYNKFKEQTNQEDDCISAAPESSYSFSDFIDHIQNERLYQNVYGGDRYYYRLTQKHVAEVTELISNYIYIKMRQQLYVDSNNAGILYMFESKDTNQTDFNKYHIVPQQLVNALNGIAFTQLAAGVYAGLSITEKEGRQQYIQVQRKGDDETINISYYNAYVNNKNVDDDDYLRFKAKMTMFSDLLQIISKNKLQYEKGTIFTERLIGGKIREYQLMGSKAPVIDQEVNIIGVYNGIVQYLPQTADMPQARIKFIYGDPCKQHYVSRSMLCVIRPEFLDQDDCLVMPDKLPAELKKIYDDIYNVGSGIYGKGEDIIILQWKIFQIVARMFQKTYTADKLFIAYGTGSDGKTTFMQAICNVLGTSNFKKTIDQETRIISSNGYASIAKSSVLQTADKNASSHDSGGLSELCGNFFQLCSELQSSTPLCVSTIKTLLCATQITARQAFATQAKAFQNTCFMELQTNYYPSFDQAFDKGTIRRVLFYSHKIKFVEQEEFDKMDSEQKTQHMVADPTIQQRFFNNWDYIDVMGYFLLIQFLQYECKDISVVPQRLVAQTRHFFNTECSYLKECVELLKPAPQEIVVWQVFENAVRETLQSHGKQQKVTDIEIKSHIERLHDMYKQDIYAYNKQKNILYRVSDNDFRSQSADGDVVIVLVDHRITDASWNSVSTQALSNINIVALQKCITAAHERQAAMKNKAKEKGLPEDMIPEASLTVCEENEENEENE